MQKKSPVEDGAQMFNLLAKQVNPAAEGTGEFVT